MVIATNKGGFPIFSALLSMFCKIKAIYQFIAWIEKKRIQNLSKHLRRRSTNFIELNLITSNCGATIVFLWKEFFVRLQYWSCQLRSTSMLHSGTQQIWGRIGSFLWPQFHKILPQVSVLENQKNSCEIILT